MDNVSCFSSESWTMSRVFYFNLTYECNYRCRYCFSHTTQKGVMREVVDIFRFRDILHRNSVGLGDRIVLNGGEPTRHSKFLSILDHALSTGAEVVVYTNGSAFADAIYANEVGSMGKFRITIPFHGGERLHDYVTGVNGSWRMACRAVANLSGNGAKSMLEPKFIISELAAAQGLDILNFLTNNLCEDSTPCDVVIAGQVNTKVAVSSGIVVRHRKKQMCYAEEQILRCSTHIPVKFYDLPICFASEAFFGKLLCSSDVRDAPCELYFTDGMIGPKVVRLSKNLRKRMCKHCKLSNICTSILNSYFVTYFDGSSFTRIME